ncbi:bifunctional 4-hydroxy-2-oxoglutarate aldolase/2-dehydro-3-deoxy-phosphogluconate aldolase [Rubrivirga sp.]|uniref:bifunctional 4-hydroxy-2-oxoglutarate aldolase/2-dehydro-3-deoxy-phosphogluconate aldolase n=1 Tax=Rubrivirga sp. TaxID=1885344 RepID=UPI003B51F63D
MTRPETVHRIARERVVAVVRTDDGRDLVDVARALVRGGVSAVEVTMTVPGALDGIARIADALGDDVVLGAGSVVGADDVRAVVEAGARYVVSPVFQAEVVEAAHAAGAAAMPGCFTPTEMQAATDAGADVVKLFPADALGPAFVRAVRAPLPHLKIMPTGGVFLDTIADWLAAGVVAVGAGSALVDPALVARRDWDALAERARLFRAAADAVGA